MKILLLISIILLTGNAIGVDLNYCPDNLTKKIGEPPKYPSHSGRPVEGWVKLKAVLSSQGKLQKIEVVESKPQGRFERSAIASLKTWEFSWEGSSCIYTKTITFELAE